MNLEENLIKQIEPDLLERHCGGWLAKSPGNCPIKIGITGHTKEDAKARYQLSIRKWVDTLYSNNYGKQENAKR